MNYQICLWKTCRVLANETRLRILRRLFRGAQLCVQDVAHAENLTEVVASQHLRQLHEHRFLQLERKSKWVFYSAPLADQNCATPHLVNVLKKQLHSSQTDLNRLIHLFTAFTHPRRIDIVKSLLQNSRGFDELVQRCDISSPALHRHLAKLIDRNFVIETNDIYIVSKQKKEPQISLLKACRTEPLSHTS